MSIQKSLEARSGSQCEMCGSEEQLSVYGIPNSPIQSEDTAILICNNCRSQIENPDTLEPNHWRCLNDCMWSPVPAVQVMAWRLLHRLKSEGWPQDLLDMLYLDEETLAWAAASGDANDPNEHLVHRDVNGVALEAGDNVVLIKDLKVKGSSMVAKQGTTVRRISLDHDNLEYIEGKVDGQQIVILTKYVKKV